MIWGIILIVVAFLSIAFMAYKGWKSKPVPKIITPEMQTNRLMVLTNRCLLDKLPPDFVRVFVSVASNVSLGRDDNEKSITITLQTEDDTVHSFEDQPAIIKIFDGGSVYPGAALKGTMYSWYRNGFKHRDGGKPAIIRVDGIKEWWIGGVRHE